MENVREEIARIVRDAREKDMDISLYRIADRILSLTTNKDPVANVPCSARLSDLVSELRVLADHFETECCKEGENRYAEGQHDGKSIAYENAADKLEVLIKKGR